MLLSILSAAGLLLSQNRAPPAGWESRIDRYFEEALKDPYTAHKRIVRGPRYDHFHIGLGQDYTGWGVCYSVNARNSYGGYTGAQLYFFIVSAGGDIQPVDGSNLLSRYAKAVLKENIAGECEKPGDDPGFRPRPAQADEGESASP